jgi:hypothetical protein
LKNVAGGLKGAIIRVMSHAAARREQEDVSLAQGDLELLGEVEQQLAARPRATRLDEAEVTRRDGGLQRELELAQLSSLPPYAQLLSRRVGHHGQR